MNDEKTQMVDLLEAKVKGSAVINKFSRSGFLIGKKLYKNSIFITSEKVELWKLQSDHVTLKDFNFLKKVKPTPELLIIGVGVSLEDPFFKLRSLILCCKRWILYKYMTSIGFGTRFRPWMRV